MESVQDGVEAVGEKLAEKLVGKEKVQEAKKMKNTTLRTVSQVLTVLSGLLSIISALILLSNYLSGTLSILDIRMRLDGYKFANEESITVKPLPFSCDECTYTFTPSAEILKTIKSKIARNGSSTIKKSVDDNGASREISVSYQKEGNTFKMESAWVMLPTQFHLTNTTNRTQHALLNDQLLQIGVCLSFWLFSSHFLLGLLLLKLLLSSTRNLSAT